MRRSSLGILLLVAAACGSPQRPSSPAAGPPASAASAPRPATEPSSGAASPCAGIIERYRARLQSASGQCRTAAECGRYGGADPDDVCGGVTDAATARDLSRISAELETAVCPRPGYSCPAMDPQCVDGRCR